VARGVAKAAMESGVAQQLISDWAAYKLTLAKRLGNNNTLSKVIETKAKQDIKRVVFTEGEEISVLKAVQIVKEEKIAYPILLGNRKTIKQLIKEHDLALSDIEIIDPKNPADATEKNRIDQYIKFFYEQRHRKGITLKETMDLMQSRRYFGPMMVKMQEADAMIGGLSKRYPAILKPALQIVGTKEGVNKVASMHILITKTGPLFLADTTVNHHLTANDVANITELVALKVKDFNIEPKIALLTYSNFGSVPNGESALLMREATAILHKKYPEWIVDGEMQAHLALNQDGLEQLYPFSKLVGHRANVLIFPNLSAANITYNLLNTVANMELIGPVMLGLDKPIHLLQMQASVRQIVDMVGIAASEAQEERND